MLRVVVEVERLRDALDDDVTLLLFDEELELLGETARLRDDVEELDVFVAVPRLDEVDDELRFTELCDEDVAVPRPAVAEPRPTEFWAAVAFDVPRDDCP